MDGRIGQFIPLTIPWTISNVTLMWLIFVFDSDNPRFMYYIVKPLGPSACILYHILEFYCYFQNFFIVVFYWLLFFIVFSAVIKHWITVIT